jgi:hypothetical protein
MDKAPDNIALAKSDIPFPFESEFASRLTMGDIAYYDYGVRKTDEELGDVKFNHLDPSHYNVVPKLNKLGKIPNKTSWDSFAYALMMGHNVYQHIESVQRANSLTDIACTSIKPSLGYWNPKIKSLDPFVPNSLIYMTELIKQVFASETPMTLLNDNSQLLKDIDGKSGKGLNRESFTTLFE